MTVQYKSKGGSRRGIEGRAAQTVLIICLLITLFLTLLPVDRQLSYFLRRRFRDSVLYV